MEDTDTISEVSFRVDELVGPSLLSSPPGISKKRPSYASGDHEHHNRHVTHLRLLKHVESREKHKHRPKWMEYYGIVSYVIYGIITFYSWCYLIYVAIYQAHPYMQIQYIYIVRFLEYNSYSILSPLLCGVFMGMLAYQVWKKIALDIGDFCGILGIFLLFALISFHDSYGMYKQVVATRDFNTSTAELDPPPENAATMNELAWKYAWSTRPACAKQLVRYLTYREYYDSKHSKLNILLETGIQKNRQLKEHEADQQAAKFGCNKHHDAKDNARIRGWMKDLQKEYKCCGPYGYPRWTEWFADNSIEIAGCDENLIDQNGEIRGCYGPLIGWLNGILRCNCTIMFVQGLLYIVAMIVALVHQRAMKYEHYREGEPHSLLDVRSETAMKDDYPWWREPRPDFRPMVIGTNVVPGDENDEETKRKNPPAGILMRRNTPENPRRNSKKREKERRSFGSGTMKKSKKEVVIEEIPTSKSNKSNETK